MKIDFLRFSRNEPLEWIYKVERFFKIYEILEDQQVAIASVHIEGRALPWFQMMEKANQIPNWLSLSTVIQIQFGPSQFENPRVELLKLAQTSTVDDYYHSFTVLANCSYGMDDTLLLDYFIGGLSPELKREVISRCPHSLLQAVSFAKLLEEKFLPLPIDNKPRIPYYNPKPITQMPPKSPQPTSNTPQMPKSANTVVLSTPSKPTQLKRLTPADIQCRREKGLCFTCDEHYTLNHKCANKHYYLL